MILSNFLCRIFSCVPSEPEQAAARPRADLGQKEAKNEALSEEQRHAPTQPACPQNPPRETFGQPTEIAFDVIRAAIFGPAPGRQAPS